MLVKCKSCTEKIDRNIAFKVVINNKNEYYCNEAEYIKIKLEKENRLKVLNIINNIFEYVVINTTLFKELSEIAQIHTYTKIFSYIQENLQMLNKSMNKNFTSEYGKIKYFTTILKNNLKDYIEPKNETIKKSNLEIINTKFQATNRKKCLNDFIEEMEE